jgi:hypothetical protein
MSDPVPEGPGTEHPAIAAMQVRAKVAHEEVIRARAALEAAEREQAFWDVLGGHLARGEMASVLVLLDRNREYTTALEAKRDPGSQELASLRHDAHEYAVSSANSLGRTFPEAAQRAGLTIDPSSRHPRYTFQGGFIRLELDERRLLAKLRTREGDEREYGLDLDLLVRALGEEVTRLFDRDFKPDTFLRSLHTAYSAVLRAEDLPEGTEVPIRKVTHRLGKNLNRFSGDEFNVDLARAIQSNHTSIDRMQLHLNHTRNTRQGMLLYGLEQGGYVGFVSFKREER